MARVPWYRLAMVSLVVEPLWNGLLVLAGLRLGEYVAQLEHGLQTLALVGTIVVFFVLLMLYRRIFARLAQKMGVEVEEPAHPTS